MHAEECQGSVGRLAEILSVERPMSVEVRAMWDSLMQYFFGLY